MDPITEHVLGGSWQADGDQTSGDVPGVRGIDVAERPEAFVLFESGTVHQRVVYDEARVEARRQERETEALAQRYSAYAQSTQTPVSFEQFADIIRKLGD